MTIGTAKPSTEELERVKHYFIDTFSVTEHVTAATFETLALSYLDEIFQSGDTAVVCGGTGLYIKALTEGLDQMPSVDETIENAVNEDYKARGLEWLQQAVRAEDPRFFQAGEVQNPARMLRALSFVRSTGKSILDYRSGNKKVRPFRMIKVALELPRELLYARINTRVEQMMAHGLLDEVRSLAHLQHLKNLQTVGYTELFDHMEGKYDLPAAVEKIAQHTRNYAKRQLTWFRKDEEYVWLRSDDRDITEKIMDLK